MIKKLLVDKGDTAFLALPGYPQRVTSQVVAKTLLLDNLVSDFEGPRVHLDFNDEGILIGIEILA